MRSVLADYDASEPVSAHQLINASSDDLEHPARATHSVSNGQVPKMSHRADQYLAPLLRGQHLLRYREHLGTLSGLFEPEPRKHSPSPHRSHIRHERQLRGQHDAG